MLRVHDDQISGWHYAHRPHNGQSNAFNWKSYFTDPVTNLVVLSLS